MHLKTFSVVAVLLSAHLPTLGAQSTYLPADSVAIGRRASAWFVAGQVDSLLAMMPRATAEFRASVQARSAEFRTRAGAEASLIEERWVWRAGTRQYWRTINVTGAAPEPIVLRWVIARDGTIDGFGLGLLSSTPPVDSLASRKR